MHGALLSINALGLNVVNFQSVMPEQHIWVLQIGFVASLVSKLSDTVSSEIGKVCSQLICTFDL